MFSLILMNVLGVKSTKFVLAAQTVQTILVANHINFYQT